MHHQASRRPGSRPCSSVTQRWRTRGGSCVGLGDGVCSLGGGAPWMRAWSEGRSARRQFLPPATVQGIERVFDRPVRVKKEGHWRFKNRGAVRAPATPGRLRAHVGSGPFGKLQRLGPPTARTRQHPPGAPQRPDGRCTGQASRESPAAQLGETLGMEPEVSLNRAMPRLTGGHRGIASKPRLTSCEPSSRGCLEV